MTWHIVVVNLLLLGAGCGSCVYSFMMGPDVRLTSTIGFSLWVAQKGRQLPSVGVSSPPPFFPFFPPKEAAYGLLTTKASGPSVSTEETRGLQFSPNNAYNNIYIIIYIIITHCVSAAATSTSWFCIINSLWETFFIFFDTNFIDQWCTAHRHVAAAVVIGNVNSG